MWLMYSMWWPGANWLHLSMMAILKSLLETNKIECTAFLANIPLYQINKIKNENNNGSLWYCTKHNHFVITVIIMIISYHLAIVDSTKFSSWSHVMWIEHWWCSVIYFSISDGLFSVNNGIDYDYLHHAKDLWTLVPMSISHAPLPRFFLLHFIASVPGVENPKCECHEDKWILWEYEFEFEFVQTVWNVNV